MADDNALAAFDSAASGAPSGGDPALAAFDRVATPPVMRRRGASGGWDAPDLRPATTLEKGKADIAGGVAGIGEGLASALTLPADAMIDLATAGPARRAVKAAKTGKYEPATMPLTDLARRAADDAQATFKDVLGVPKEADTSTQDKVSRVVGTLLAPVGPAKVAKDAKALEEFDKIAPKAAETVAEATNPLVDKITKALKEAKPLRREQEAIYTKTRAERITESVAAREGTSGEVGFKKELEALGGDMPKVQFESLRKSIGQEDIDALFNQVRDYEGLSDFQKISARRGLAKMFGEYGGQVPQANELGLLKRVFGPQMVDALAEHRGTFDKLKDIGMEIGNIPRALMASFDVSAPFRQGVVLSASKPKQFFGAFPEMFKAFGSEKAYQALNDSIVMRPSYDLMRESGLAITDLEAVSSREERFASNLAEKIPVIGRGVRASGRAYTGFLNKLRADVFDDLVSRAESLGLKPDQDAHLTHSIAKFINNASGRGDVSALPLVGRALEPAQDALNAMFFSPKLAASRLTLMNPAYYVKQPAFVRTEAIKAMLSFVAAGTSVASLASLAGAKVGLDPTSSDFGKIRTGNTRIDVWGGFQQYVRMASQLALNKYTSATTGRTQELGQGFRAKSRLDILQRQVESKLAPTPSFVVNLLRQQDYRGEPVNVPSEIASRFVPMVMQDMTDVLADNPKLAPVGLAGATGVGVQTFRERGAEPAPSVVLKRAFGSKAEPVTRVIDRVFGGRAKGSY